MIENFLERDAPIAQLQELLAKVSEGQGTSVLVTGEAGAGKTTFFNAFKDLLDPTVRVFQGACEDLSIPEPLGPVREFARSAGWEIDSEQLKSGQRLEAFAHVLNSALDPDLTTILIIEDLHWADEATLDFVRFAARRIAPMRIMLLINSRDIDDTAQQRLRAAFNGVSADSLVRIALQSLTLNAVAELAGPASTNSEKLFEQSGGNAFYVTELLRNSETQMPTSVQDAVLLRAEGLSAGAQNILNIVSIFPRRAELDLVMGLDGEDCFEEVEECIAEGILIEADDYLAFRHEIARLAVENGLSALKKRALNAKLYSLLSNTVSTPKARLMHHARAGRLRDAVRELAPDAAHEAEAAGAFRQSAEYYEIALEFGNELPKEDLAVLLEKASRVLGIIARQPDAIASLEQALVLRKSLGQDLASADNLRKLARLHWEIGLKPQAKLLADEAIDIAEDMDSYELAWSYAGRGQIAMTAFEFKLAAIVSKKAMEIADRNGFGDIKSFAQTTLGLCNWGNAKVAIPLLESGLSLAMVNNMPEHAARAYSNIGVFLSEHYQYAEAIVAYDKGIGYCNQHDIRAGSEFLKAWRLEVRERMGLWDEVYDGAQTLISEGLQHSSAKFFAQVCLARIAMRRGYSSADTLLDQLDSAVKNGEDARHITHYAVLLAEKAYLGLAEPEPALKLMAEVLAMPIFPAGVEQFFPWQKRLGVSPTFEWDQIFNEPYRLNIVGDWQGEALAWSNIGCPYQEALVLLEGDVASKARALGILDGLGATVVADFARGKMREDGIAINTRIPRASTKANPAGLTKRQLDVLRLLNDGLTNAEIGDKLFVSAKTVDHHVSAILAKLEVSNRGEAAAQARAAGWI